VNVTLWIAQGLLVAMYGMAGMMKAFRTSKAREQLPWAKDRSAAFVKFIGTSELLGALGVVLPMVTGVLIWLSPAAAIGLSVVQILAIGTIHLPKKEFKVLPMNLALLALSVFMAIGRWQLFMS